jgi:hypothetical protein
MTVAYPGSLEVGDFRATGSSNDANKPPAPITVEVDTSVKNSKN